jgi:hypothetical protein
MAENDDKSIPENAQPNTVFFAAGDVNGDGQPEYVYLTGSKVQDGQLLQDISLVVQDPKTGNVVRVVLGENTGYNPRLFLGDFTGDGVDDIMISIASGASGGTMYHYIYTYLGSRPVKIFDFARLNESASYDVRYRNNYRVSVRNRRNGMVFLIDLAGKGRQYLSEIYEPDGKLKEPIEGWVDPLSGLYPVDFNLDGTYELLAYQQISGRYHADSLGYILTYLRWARHGFSPYDQQVAVYGSGNINI